MVSHVCFDGACNLLFVLELEICHIIGVPTSVQLYAHRGHRWSHASSAALAAAASLASASSAVGTACQCRWRSRVVSSVIDSQSLERVIFGSAPNSDEPSSCFSPLNKVRDTMCFFGGPKEENRD